MTTTQTRRSPRYRITTDGHTVTLETADAAVCQALGEYAVESLRRVYWVREGTGYVYDVTRRPGTLGQQVCEQLSGIGSTLYCARDSLPAVIRRELRRALADMERSHRRY